LLDEEVGRAKDKAHKRVQGYVFIIIIVVIRLMCLLGLGTVTLASRATRSSRWVWTASTTWALSTHAHLPLPLGKRDVILIGVLLDNLLAGTTHLRDLKILHKMDVKDSESIGLVHGLNHM
jgi:hypothetical protein